MHSPFFIFFFFNDTATTEIYTLSLHDALPISQLVELPGLGAQHAPQVMRRFAFHDCGLTLKLFHEKSSSHAEILSRSEEHTSELQSPCNLVCRLLLEKKKKNI